MPETLFLTANLIDRFLEKKRVSRRNLQLVCISAPCLLLIPSSALLQAAYIALLITPHTAIPAMCMAASSVCMQTGSNSWVKSL